MNEVTTRVSSSMIPQNGYVGKGQTQPLGGSEAQVVASQGIQKGGMRGLGLIAVMIAETILKKKTTDLAEDYLKLNRKDYNNFIAIHQTAIASTVSEAMSPTLNPVYNHDYYAAAPAGMAKSAVLDKQWFETRRRTHRYALGLQKRVDFDFALIRMHGVVAGWFVGRRYEMAYADEHNNRRFDRKIEAGNIGIGIGNIVREGLASSVNRLASAYDNIGDTVSTIGNGLAANTGYKQGRADTAARYPERGLKKGQ